MVLKIRQQLAGPQPLRERAGARVVLCRKATTAQERGGSSVRGPEPRRAGEASTCAGPGERTQGGSVAEGERDKEIRNPGELAWT